MLQIEVPGGRVRDVIAAIEQRLDHPTARGLALAVSRTIRDGDLAPGARLPPIRQLAKELALSPTTVSAAWSALGRAGAIRTSGRRGTRVADDVASLDSRLDRVPGQDAVSTDLSTGGPDARLVPSLADAIRGLDTTGTPDVHLGSPVLPDLLDVLHADWPYAAEAITVVDGALDALDLVVRACLRFGDRVVVEDPTSPPLLDLLQDAGAEVVGVAMDDSGIDPDGLAAALDTSTAMVFLHPRAHDPTGAVMTPARLEQVADLLRGRGALVVEVDSAPGISAANDVSLGALLPESTVLIRSFASAYGPDLPLAALSGPVEVIAAIGRLRQLGRGWSSRLLQRLLLGVLTLPEARAEVAVARDEYAARRSRFRAILAEHGVETGGADGLNVWVPVVDESLAVLRLASVGIGVAPGHAFAVGDPATAGGHIRVTVGLLGRETELDPVAHEVALAARLGAPCDACAHRSRPTGREVSGPERDRRAEQARPCQAGDLIGRRCVHDH